MQVIQYDKNPSAEGAIVRLSRTGATPSLSADAFANWPPIGNMSHKFVTLGTSITTVGIFNADRPAAAAGQVWSARATVRNSAAGSRALAVSIVFYDTFGATLGTALQTTTSQATVAAGAIAELSVSGVTAPAGTASVDIQVSRLAGSGAATSDPVHFDKVTLTRTATAQPYRDPATDALATWTGTANASTQIYWTPAITVTPEPAHPVLPCITVLVDDLPPTVTSLTLFRSAGGRSMKVRGAVSVAVSSGFSVQDGEAPFLQCDYRAELFTASGVSAGFTVTASATLDVDECWVHNPLDPAGATIIGIDDTSAKSISRPIRGKRYTPEQRTLGVLITGRRSGVEGAELYFSTDDPTVAEKFEAMFGGYGDDDQQIPVLCIRTPPFLDLPMPFFAGALSPTRRPINVHMGGSLREWDVTADETAPPFPGIVLALLRRMDIDYAFATRAALDAAYASRLHIDRDYTKAGIAP